MWPCGAGKDGRMYEPSWVVLCFRQAVLQGGKLPADHFSEVSEGSCQGGNAVIQLVATLFEFLL